MRFEFCCEEIAAGILELERSCNLTNTQIAKKPNTPIHNHRRVSEVMLTWGLDAIEAWWAAGVDDCPGGMPLCVLRLDAGAVWRCEFWSICWLETGTTIGVDAGGPR